MVIVFAGTTEGRQLAERLSQANRPALVCVATEYGADLLQEARVDLRIRAGRLEEAEMETLFRQEKPELVVDATHPHATVVTDHIRQACQNTNCRYLRVLREETSWNQNGAVCLDTVQAAAQYLEQTEGTIFLTTGSKEAAAFSAVASRCVARVLPTEEAMRACRSAGLSSDRIIAQRGPFSYEQNYFQLKQAGASFLVTKESGRAGGFEEKLQAAQALGATPVVIRRPRKEAGMTVNQAWKEINRL